MANAVASDEVIYLRPAGVDIGKRFLPLRDGGRPGLA
jgi:hypothetical protein